MTRPMLLITMLSLSLTAQTLPLLEPNKWSPHKDGGAAPSYEKLDDDSVRFSFNTQNGKFGWGNIRMSPLTLPPKSTGLSFEVFVEEATDNAVMHVWLFEKDKDAWLSRVNFMDGKGLSEVKNTWRKANLPFASFRFEPRGAKNRNFMSVEYMLFGFNFGNQTVRVRNLALTGEEVESMTQKPSIPQDWKHKDPVGQRIAIYSDESVEKLPSHADAQRLANLLKAKGFHPQIMTSGDLSSPNFLSKQAIDLLILPNAPFFPLNAVQNFRKFLKDKGSFISIGGYPLDRPGVPTKDGWATVDSGVTADKVGTGEPVDTRLNTRYGTHGDTMQLQPDQIGLCDPSFLLLRTRSLRPAPKQKWFNSSWSFGEKKQEDGSVEGPAAVAMTGSNSPVFPNVHARYIPLIQSLDFWRRNRGPAAAAVLNHAGPYNGSNWAMFTPTNRNLFDGSQPVLDELFVDLCRKLLAPTYLINTSSDKPCARRGDAVAFTVSGINATGHPLRVRFIIDDKEFAVATAELDRFQVSVTWNVPQDDHQTFHTFTAELLDGETAIDMLENGISVWSQDALSKGLKFELKNNYFNLNGQPTFFIGANTTGMMWYSANENPLVWKKDFAAMQDYGLNFLRILHFSPFAHLPVNFRWNSQALLEQPPYTQYQTDAIVQLAQEHQIMPFLSLHDWIGLDLSQSDLDAQKTWNKFWVNRYKDVPGMFYDIQNEPTTGLGNTEALMPLFKEFLVKEYGSVENAQQAWMESGADTELTLSAKAKNWQDLRARDIELFRSAVFTRWVRENQEGIKASNPKALATVGHLQTLTSCDKFDGADEQDFVNVHHYGALTNMRSVIKMMDRRFDGKSISLGEMGSAIAHSARNSGQWGDTAEASIRHYLAVGHCSIGMGVSFMGCWSWKDFQDCVFPWGINHADLTAKPVLEAYRNMALLFRNAHVRYESPSIFIVIPDGIRSGYATPQIHENLRVAIDTLLTLNVPFGVINEWKLGKLPKSAQALVWPLAYGAKDETFAQIASFVANGGRLLMTGDPRFGWSRQPDRPDRLAKLGLKADFAPIGLPGAKTFMANILSENKSVLWQPAAAEMLDRKQLRVLYQDFLDNVSGLQRIRLNIDNGSLMAFDVPLHNGRAFTLVNFADAEQSVTVPAHNGYPKLDFSVAPLRTVFLQWDNQGNLVAANAFKHLEINGKAVFSKLNDTAVISLDGKDIRQSSQLALLPFQNGVAIDIIRDENAKPFIQMEIGEFQNGKWHMLSRFLPIYNKPTFQNTDAPYDIRLLMANDEIGKAQAALENLLLFK